MKNNYSDATLENIFSKNKLKLVKKILKYSVSLPTVQFVLLQGPYARNEQSLYSEVNLFVLLNNRNINKIKESFLVHLKEDVDSFLNFESRIKIFSYLVDFKGSFFDKIEIKFANNTDDLNNLDSDYLINSNNVNNIVLYSKDSNVGEKIKNYFSEPKIIKTDIEKELKTIFYRFVEIFEEASTRVYLGDIYYFAFYLTEAFQILYRLDYLSQNATFPEEVLWSDYWTSKQSTRVNFFREYYPQIDLQSMNEYKEKYLNIFVDIMGELSNQYILNLNIDSVKNLLVAIIKRDYIWNLRDFSVMSSDTIVSEKLYRSSALARYKNDAIFQEVLEKTGIKTIIDLRTEPEKIKHFYGDSLKKHDVNYLSFPIGPKQIEMSKGLKYATYNDYHGYYEIFPRYYQKELKKLLISFLDIKFPVLIHCYAGRDRTGIIVALIMKLLGSKDEEIIQEYMNSGVLTSKEYIRVVFNVIDEFGGIQKYFEHIGISTDQISRLKVLFSKTS
jgi:protein tyrosine/serine phosphatase